MDDFTLDELRKRFFVEVWQPQAFADPRWRGCALDRDVYTYNTRMPRFFFEAIAAASSAKKLFIATDLGPDLYAEIPPTWDAYTAHMGSPDQFAIDYLIHDGSGAWAILADFDVTHFGAAPELADKVDKLLAKHGTSLGRMTMDAFESLWPDPHLVAVVGGGS